MISYEDFVFPCELSFLEYWYRSVNNVHEAWFADEEKVRKAVGIMEKPLVKFSNSVEVSYLFVDIVFQVFLCSHSECILLTFTHHNVLNILLGGLWDLFWELLLWQPAFCFMCSSFLWCMLERFVFDWLAFGLRWCWRALYIPASSEDLTDSMQHNLPLEQISMKKENVSFSQWGGEVGI